MKTITLATPGSAGDVFLDEISADGNYALFFPPGSIDDVQLYLTDVQTGETQTVAVANSNFDLFVGPGEQDVSDDGKFVVYNSLSVSGTDSVDTYNIFDRETGTTSVALSESEPIGGFVHGLAEAKLSADDQSLFFTSDFPDLTGAGDSAANDIEDLFQLNLQTGSVQRLLVDTEFGFTMSPGGQYLTTEVENGNTLPDGDSSVDLYRVDTATGDLNVIASNLDFDDDNRAALSEDGRFAVINTSAALLPEDTNSVEDVYLEDLSTGELTLISKSASGALGNGASEDGAISADGSRIVFETEASNLSPGASATDPHIVSMDLATGAVGLLFDNAQGSPFEVSADGETLAIDSTERLTANDTDNANDVYLLHFTPPKLTINPINGDGYVNAADNFFVTLSGKSDAYGQLVDVTAAGLETTALVQSDGTWSTSIYTLGVADGAYDVHALVSDGLTATADSHFTVDRTPPQLTFTSVAADDIINAAELSHATIVGSVLATDPSGPGTVQSTVSISIDGGPSQPFLTAGANTSPTADNFSQGFDASGIPDGEHTITLTATDEAGNTTSVTKDVLVDTTPPKIAITSVSGDDVVDSNEIKTAQGVQGTSDAIGQTVDVLVDGVVADQAVVQADGTWISTVSFASTVTGNHDVTAQVSDEAGNVGRADAGVYVDAGFAVTQLSDGPDGEQGGGQGVLFPSLSADGTKLVFTGLNFDLMSSATGSSGAQVYIKDLTTGAITFATPNPSDNAEFGAISQDGTKIVFVSNASLDPANQALNGDGPGYYTYEENLSDGIPHIRVFDSQTPDNLDPSSLIPAGDHLAQPLPYFPLAIANNGYDSEMVETTNIDKSGTVDLFENFVLDGSVNASGQPTPPFNQLATLVPKVSSFPGTFQAYAPEFSADGSIVAFEGRFNAEQPTGTQPGPSTQIYAGPTASNHIPLASSFSDGTPMPFGAIDPALSADGKFVAFWSWGNDGAPEVFVKNLTTGELKVASSDASGNPGVDNASGTFNAGFNSIAISADGRYVAFTSDANLTPDDSGTGADLYVKDMQSGAIERVNLPAGTLADDLSTQLTMRADGQYVAFVTSAGLSAMDGNHTADVYGISLASLGTPPQIAINPVADDDRINAAEVSNNLAVSGTSDDIGGTVTLVVDGNTLSSVVVGSDGTWSTIIDATQLIDGVHQFRATVTNANGSTGSDGDLVTVDRVAPTVVLSSDQTHLAAGQTATITATFSEGIGNLQSDFLVASGGALSDEKFVDNHTYTATFTPDAGATSFSITANPDTAFDFAGNPNTGASLTVGAAFDGYIVGGTVRYANGSGNGATATTDASGNFSLSGGTGPLLLTGGTDSATGLPFTGTLEAPDGATVVSPLTTLVEKVIETSGDSVTQANAAVASALGLPAGIDLTTLDAVAGALSGDAASTAAFKAGSELLDAITLIQAAGGSPDLAYAALAADVAAGSTVNLADAATITAIGESAGLDTATAQAVASIASETAAALELQLAHAATPFEVFTDITGSSIAEQGDAATALSRAVGDTAFQQVADSYFQNLGTTLSRDDLTAAENVACYCPGTLIATDRGDIAVENLRVGGGVVVMSGSVRPIKWIGQRSYGGRFIAGRKDMLPICFKAGSLGEGLPRRDLWISPHHAMYLDGVLIEAKDLVNGVSVVQAEEVDRVDYFHIELDSHDVILAEGAWSETFVDDDSRGMFHNAPEFAALYPGDVSRPARYCAPRLEEGFEIEAIRRRLARLAGAAGASQVGALRGFVDHASAGCIAGWAQNEQHPEAPVCLDIYVRGQLVGHALANCYREDLREAGVGSGRHGFSFVPKPGCRFTPEEVLVKRSLDGVGLPITAEARSAALSAAA